MNLKNIKLAYYLPSLAFYLSFQILNWQATWLWGFLLFILLINFFNLRFMPGIRLSFRAGFLLAVVPALFSLGAIIYSSLLSSRFSLQFLILLAALIIYQYWRLAYKKLSPKPIKHKLLQIFGRQSTDLAFIGVSLYVNFLAMFLLVSSFLAIKYFLGLAYWLMFVLLAIVVLSLTLAAAEVSDSLKQSDQSYFWLIVSLVIWQIGLCLFFLPLSYSVSGFLLALAFYAAINLSRFSLAGELRANRLKWYIGFPLLASFILLFSARWL